MKTRALKILLLLFAHRAGAEGFNPFECLREMIPLTERGTYQAKRSGVEKPFFPDEKHIVFPEVTAHKVSGFYIYDREGAYFYDAVELKSEAKNKVLNFTALLGEKDRTLYQMVAQPNGLETLTLYYLPGFDSKETNRSGPVMLGSSVMPVIGAFVTRPEQYDYVYQNPQDLPEARLLNWIAKNHAGGRAPAATPPELKRQIVHLLTKAKKSEDQLWKPLRTELQLRRNFVRDHNIDDQTFQQIRHAMNGVCRES